MRTQHLPVVRTERDPCPVCGLEITLDVVEPHPVDERLEIQGYICDKCGPVKSLVVLRSLPLHLLMYRREARPRSDLRAGGWEKPGAAAKPALRPDLTRFADWPLIRAAEC